MGIIYHDFDYKDRAEQSKEHAKLSVEVWRQKNLPTYTPTVIRDLEQRESERESQ